VSEAGLDDATRQRPEMLGSFEYWVREGHPLEGADAGSATYAPDLSGLITPTDENATIATWSGAD
jgi:hypothetical protein